MKSYLQDLCKYLLYRSTGHFTSCPTTVTEFLNNVDDVASVLIFSLNSDGLIDVLKKAPKRLATVLSDSTMECEVSGCINTCSMRTDYIGLSGNFMHSYCLCAGHYLIVYRVYSLYHMVDNISENFNKKVKNRSIVNGLDAVAVACEDTEEVNVLRKLINSIVSYYFFTLTDLTYEYRMKEYSSAERFTTLFEYFHRRTKSWEQELKK